MGLLTASSSISSADVISAEFVPQSNLWVKLRDPLSAYSFDEALLLCEKANGGWIAWVPDLGEVTLDRHQFYSLDSL